MMNLKKFLACALAVTALLSASACGNGTTQNTTPNGMIGISGDIVDYDLYVPDSWIADEASGAVSAYRSSEDPTSISMMTWSLPYSDSTLADWWTMYQEDFTLVFDDFTLVSNENVLLDGTPAEKYVYTGRLGDTVYRYTQIAAVRNTAVYLLTMTELDAISEETSATHLEELSKILDNFRWR